MKSLIKWLLILLAFIALTTMSFMLSSCASVYRGAEAIGNGVLQMSQNVGNSGYTYYPSRPKQKMILDAGGGWYVDTDSKQSYFFA